MSSPAELLAQHHAAAAALATASAPVSSPSIEDDSPAISSETQTSVDNDVDDSVVVVDEITQVQPKKKINLFDEDLCPSLGDIAPAASTPVQWGPSSTGSPISSWAKASSDSPNSFKPAVKSTSTQVTFIIDDDQQQNLAKSDIFKIFAKIKSSLKVNVESTYSSATKKRTFLLDGPSDNIVIAKKELIRQLTKPTKITFEIPSKLRSTIIGSGGKTLKPIIESASVKIDIARESDSKDDELLTEDEELFGKSLTVTIEGDIQGCTDAKSMIMAIVNENTKNLNVKIPVSEKLKPFAKSEISKLSFKKGVEVVSPEASSKLSNIIISGDREGVIDARNQIKTALTSLDNSIVVEEREIPKHLHQLIDLERVLNETDVVIELPLPSDVSSKAKLIGLKSNIPNALKLAKQITADYFVEILDLAKSHGGNINHAKNLVAFFIYTKYLEALGNQYDIKITGPSYQNLVDSNVKSVTISFTANNNKEDEVKKARKDLVDTVNKISPNFIESITDIESFIFPKIDNSVAVENNVSIVPLGQLAGSTNILLLVAQQNDDEFLPSADQIVSRLETVNKSLDKLRALNSELITETIQTPSEDQSHLEGNTLKVLLNKYEPDSIDIKLHQNSEGPSDNEIYLRGYKSEIRKAIDDIKQLIEDVKNYEEASKYNTIIEVPSIHLPRIIGQKGQNLNQLRDEFDVKIDVLTDNDSKLEEAEIKLTGLKSNVDECIKKIHQLVKKWADEKTVVVNVEQKYRRQLIGPNGIYANRLQDKYNVKLQFSDAEDKNGNVVIRGPSRGVAKVEEEIKQLLAYEKENGFKETIQVPRIALPRVIGKNGENIKDISAEAGVEIHTRNNDDKESEVVDFEIIGSKNGIKEAKKAIEEISERVINFDTQTIDVDHKWYGNLIGPNGMTMRQLIIKAGGSPDDRDFRRYIQFPPRNSESTTITCEGNKEVVSKIISEIETIIKDLESITTESVDIPKSQHKLIIGAGGSVRRGIDDEFKVRVNVPKQESESETITVKGKPADIEKAIAKIQELTTKK